MDLAGLSWMNGLKAFGLIGLGQALIMSSVYFTSGALLPSLFGGIYAAVPFFGRLVIALATGLLVANLLIAKAFALYTPALSAPISIFCVVVVQIVFAVLIFRLQPTLWLWLATACVAASCVWVSVLMNQSPN